MFTRQKLWMSLFTVGCFSMNFAGAETNTNAYHEKSGGEPADKDKDALPWPKEWVVFGPFSNSAPLDAAMLSSIPGEVNLQGQKGRKIELTVDGETMEVDLGLLAGGKEMGKTAYLFAEISSDRDRDVMFGSGCDWWMQWWVNGKQVYETMSTGNVKWPPSIEDHKFTVHLAKGTNILAVQAVSGTGSFKFVAGMPEELKKPCPPKIEKEEELRKQL